MRISIIAVGKLKASYAQAGCADFLNRLGRYAKVEHVEVRDTRRNRGGTVAEWKRAEAAALLKHVPKGATRVVLDERGRQWGSQELARWLNGLKNQAVSSVAFMLGGPDGLDRSVIESADRVWSLGTLTLPHELARLVVCEQLYRANSVLAGHPYHRE